MLDCQQLCAKTKLNFYTRSFFESKLSVTIKKLSVKSVQNTMFKF